MAQKKRQTKAPLNKKTPHLTKSDWTDVMRQSQWQSDYRDYIIQGYLGVEDIGDVYSNKAVVGIARSLILRACLDKFIKLEELNILRIVDINSYRQSPPVFTNIEISPKETINCLSEGTIFFETAKKERVLLTIEPREQAVLFIWHARGDDRDVIQGLSDRFSDFANQNNFLRGKKLAPDCSFIAFDKTYTWDDLIVPDTLKAQIKTNLSTLIDNAEIYRKNNLTVKRGLIFSGKPGTGKTLLGKILCGTTDWTFLWVTPQYMTRPSDVAQVVAICQELSPTILFLEDVDLYGAAREESRDTSVLGELMNQLDGVQDSANIITIATTNKVEVIEKALAERPGRFDKVVAFDLPDEAARLNLLKLFTKNLQLDPELDLVTVATLANGCSGAQIRELVNFATLTAVETKSYDADQKIILKIIHFRKALKSAQKKDFDSVRGFEGGKKAPISERFRAYLDDLCE